jgi:CheY-like chemotaxis protein
MTKQNPQTTQNTVLCCYHPTTPLLIDDEPQHLNGVMGMLRNVPKPYTYANPQEALKFIQEEYQPSLMPDALSINLKNTDADIETDRLSQHEHTFIDIDISVIHQVVFNPNRFKEIAVAIVDYAMPQLNGLLFFEQTQDVPFQKFLLTGHASQALGIEAFNVGTIHQFIEKTPSVFVTQEGSQEFKKRLNAIFRQLEVRYFQLLFEDFYRQLVKNVKSALGEPFFAELFDRIIQENKIVEYYLVSDTGCFLMLDADGHKSWLIVKSEDEMKYYHVSAVENEAPDRIIRPLEKREKMPFLFSQHDYDEVPYEEWDQYFQTVEKVKGEKNTFYYAYIQSQPIYDRQLKKIVSYHQFLDSQ